MKLTRDEIDLILDALAEKYGPGYSREQKVGALQAKLSMMKELVSR